MHDNCPLGNGELTKIMVKLEHLETLLEEQQKNNERRLGSLEGTVGKQTLIAGVVSAAVAGVVLAVKYAIKGGNG